MAARFLLIAAPISYALLTAASPAAAQSGTARVQISGGMSESFDLVSIAPTFGSSGELQLMFLGPNQQELYIKANGPISTGTISAPPCAAFDCAASLMLVPSSDPPYGNLTTVSSTAPDHQNSCTIRIDVKDAVGVRGSFDCTFNSGRVRASGQFATTSVSAPAGPPPEAMALGLVCDRDNLQEFGRVSCNAAVSNIHDGAQIAYRWTVDGVERSETGRDLSLSDITVGSHTISVSAADQSTSSSIGSESVSFTRYTPGSPEAEDASKPGRSRAPLIAGAAIAVAIAIGTIASRGKKARAEKAISHFHRPKPPTSGPEAMPSARQQWKPLSASALTATAPPKAGPEDLPRKSDDRKRKRPRPTLFVKIILRPSVLTQQLYNSRDVKLLGDSVDFTFAGYELVVGPPGEWDIDNSMLRYRDPRAGEFHAIDATWTVTGGEWKPVSEFAKLGEADFRNLPLNDPFATQTDSHNAVIFSRKWSEKDKMMSVGVKVRARVRSADHAEIDYVEAIDVANEPIIVVGAKPDLTLTINNPTRRSFGITPDEGGALKASADGKSELRVEPVLYLFDGIYAGGLRIVGIDNRVAPRIGNIPARFLEDFFEVIRDDPRVRVAGGSYVDQPQKLMMREGITLRCLFRLGIEGMEGIPDEGFPLSMKIEPTGSAYGLEKLDKRFDWVLRDHYKACAAQYQRSPMSQSEPVHIGIIPAKIEITGAEPHLLPLPYGDDRFKSVIKATVRNIHGDLISGDDIKKDIIVDEIQKWHFRLWYDPPAEEWRRDVDPGLKQEEGLVFHASDVDKEGHVMFGKEPFFEYHHLEHFGYKPVKRFWRKEDVDEENKYIRAQSCDINIEFRVLSTRLRHNVGTSPEDWASYRAPHPIHIDWIEQEEHKVTVTVSAQSREGLAGANVAIGPVHCPDWQIAEQLESGRRERIVYGKTDENGEVTLSIPSLYNPYRVRVDWTSSPMTGMKFPPSPFPNEPPPVLRDGTRVSADITDRYYRDDKTGITLDVNTAWAIQTDLSATAGASIGLVGGGVVYMTAILVNRTIMPTGNPPGGFDQVFSPHAAPDPAMWRRMLLVGLYGSIGKSPLDIVGVDASDPGATDFRTLTPVAFNDFHKSRTRIWSGGFDLVGGYGIGVVNFDEVATDPVEVRLDSLQAGFSGVTLAQAVRAKWILLD